MALSSADFASTLLVSAVPRVAESWLHLSEEFRSSVLKKGLATVVVFRSVIDGELEEMAELVQELGGCPEDVPIAFEIWEGLEAVARTELRRLAHTPTPTVAAAAIISGRQRAAAAAALSLDSAPTTDATSRRAVRRCHLEAGAALTDWPSSLKRSRVLASDPNARAIREESVRERWVHALMGEVAAAKLPFTELLESSQNPASLMSIVAQGRRARTLRRRVLDWRAAARFFFFSCGTPWPRSVGEVLDYLASIVEGSKGRSALCRAVYAIGFMEKAGGVNEADR